jgi:ubiquinone/menaquinone biosynthesis C-methylase UbiE/DNA-binding transcriptional ArsR family regulator
MNAIAVFQQLASLADATRARLLQVLERDELTVSELCAVVQLPQSTVSRHLRILTDEGWLAVRSEGTSRYYRLSTGLEPGARRLWEVVREPLAGTAEAKQDADRAREVLQRRRTRSQEFFSSAAGRWDSVRAELFGASPELPALLALLDPSWEVGDLGCGTGRVAETIAPYVRRVVAVDDSGAMLAAARQRLGPAVEAGGAGGAGGKVELRQGRLESLPLADGSLDVALLVLVLHYVAQPALALSEAERALRPGGRLLVVDMAKHGRSEYREHMGHLWPGFGQDELGPWLEDAGFGGVRYHGLPADPAARGPLLFTAVATKP